MWVSWTIAIVFGLLGLFYYLRSRKFKKLEYYYRTTSIVVHATKSVPVEILYNGTQVEEPVLTQVQFRSAGSQEIKRDDFEDDLIIELAGVRSVLTVELLRKVPKNLTVKFAQVGSTLRVEPLLLNPGDGVDFQVISDGRPSSVQVMSRISGLRQARRITIIPTDPGIYGDSNLQRLASGLRTVFLIFTTIVVVSIIWFNTTSNLDDLLGLAAHDSNSQANPLPTLAKLILTTLVISSWILWLARRIATRRKIRRWITSD